MEVLGWHSIRSVKWHVLQVAVREGLGGMLSGCTGGDGRLGSRAAL